MNRQTLAGLLLLLLEVSKGKSEKNSIYDEFQLKINTLVNGTVQQVEGSDYLINLGRRGNFKKRIEIPGAVLILMKLLRFYY